MKILLNGKSTPSLLLTLSFLVTASYAAKVPDAGELDEMVSSGGVLDEILVKFDSTNANENAIRGLLQRTSAQTGCTNPTRVFAEVTNAELEAKHQAAGFHLWYSFDCEGADPQNNGKGRGTQAAINRLVSSGQLDGLDIVEAGLTVRHIDPAEQPQEVGGDPLFRWLRGNRNLAVSSNDPYLNGYQDHYNTIKLREAWQIMNDKGAWNAASNVVVQVIDTGMDLNHVDLQNQWVNQDETCTGGTDLDGNGYIDDCHGYNHADKHGGTDLYGSGIHGSHCSVSAWIVSITILLYNGSHKILSLP